jgi:GH24 family phage-related lysozyme (muramidase)
MVMQVIAAGAAFGALSEHFQWVWVPNYREARVAVTGTDFDVEARALAIAKGDIISYEGRRSDAYIDSQGILTIGIGHKVLPSEPYKLGSRISDSQIDAFFTIDIAKAFEAATKQAKELDKYTPVMIAALTSVNFQLGTGWRNKFPNTWTQLVAGNIPVVVNKLLASAWNQQTPVRVASFINAIKSQYA